ncbi:hypothetical protein CRUP_018121 [Coryphaenoides rupestris]|nr:hypothetical protein CRUP_018121 [Coryphaenoides rupestris]
MPNTRVAMEPRGAGLLFLELRKRLKSGVLIIGKDLVRDPAEVLSVAGGGEGSLGVLTVYGLLRLALPAGVSLEQGSCVQTAGEGVGSPIERLRTEESYCFHCQACKTRLLDDRVFRRVLPLPNGNWNAIVDDWCCHPDPFADLKLLVPRADDCLLGDTFLLLARDHSCRDTLLEEEVTHGGAEDGQDPKKSCRRLVSVSCKSCSAVLGETVAPESLKLYITQVVVERAVGGSQVEASIWLLNTDSITASVASVEEACVRQADDAGDTGDAESPATRARPALKLLWITCADRGVMQRDVVKSWETNSIGHPLVLPLAVCEELLQSLEDSNALLPYVLRHMRSYQVAYLRL